MNASPGVPDAELLARSAGGDAGAFEALVERHETPLYRFAVRMCLDSERAQDAVQEALLSAWRDAASFRAGSSVRTWLFSVMINACRHLQRTRAGQPRQTEPLEAAREAPADDPGPEKLAARAELSVAVDAALAELPPQERQVLLLRDVEGLSGDDVAQMLGLSLAAMKSRLHRARIALKQRLEEKLS